VGGGGGDRKRGRQGKQAVGEIGYSHLNTVRCKASSTPTLSSLAVWECLQACHDIHHALGFLLDYITDIEYHVQSSLEYDLDEMISSDQARQKTSPHLQCRFWLDDVMELDQYFYLCEIDHQLMHHSCL
jgi:hypothetical protein